MLPHLDPFPHGAADLDPFPDRLLVFGKARDTFGINPYGETIQSRRAPEASPGEAPKHQGCFGE